MRLHEVEPLTTAYRLWSAETRLGDSRRGVRAEGAAVRCVVGARRSRTVQTEGVPVFVKQLGPSLERLEAVKAAIHWSGRRTRVREFPR